MDSFLSATDNGKPNALGKNQKSKDGMVNSNLAF
jgi:hypothetical protein